MKKIYVLVASAILGIANVQSQTIYDAVRFTQKDLNGNARFVGMGGAMGALGANISTMGTNPAGIGLYRSSDVMTSFGFSANNVESTFNGNSFNKESNPWSYDNIGFVYSSKMSNVSALRFVNFGFNYTRSKSFDKYMSMEGVLNGAGNNSWVSQTQQMAHKANQMRGLGNDIELLANNGARLFDDSRVGWLSAIGWNGFLYNKKDKDAEYESAFNSQPNGWFNSREKGGIDQYDFNMSVNLSDRVYLGVTLGAYDVNYSKESTYGESFGNYKNFGEQGYEMTTENQIKGSGIDFKMGCIVRPFEESPLRLGGSIHTPVFYDLSVRTNARLSSNVGGFNSSTGQEGVFNHVVDSYSYLNDMDYGYDFRLRTPWTYNLSLGYVFPCALAIGAEYEYEDYSAVSLSYSDGARMEWENSTANEMLKGVQTVRVGAEWKVIPQFAMRLGYNYMTQAFRPGAYKDLSPNSIQTDTDFANAKAQSNYTFGIGYQGRVFYADLACLYSTFKEDFYPFEHQDLAKTTVTNKNTKVLFTLGMRF